MLELGRALLLLLVAASAFLGWRWVRRGAGPVSYWILGWAAAGLGGALSLVPEQQPLLHFLSHPLGTLFATLLLCGALTYAERPVPAWLLPAAAAFGLTRAAVAMAGHLPLAWGMGLACEPLSSLAAAGVVWRAASRGGRSTSERLLGPALTALAAVGVAHLSWLASGRNPQQLVSLWLVVAPPVLGLQIQASANRLRRRVRRELEARVVERTAALADSEERYRVISEQTSDLSFRVRFDAERRLSRVWSAGAVETITGMPPEAFDGAGWRQLLDDAARARVLAELDAAPVGQRVPLELEIRGHGGVPRWLAVRLTVIARDAAGAVEVIGSASDATERRRVEQEQRRLEGHLQQVQKLESLGVLAGGIAHDFNNLLTVIRGNVRLALDELPAGSPLRLRLERIRDAAQHAGSLTERMLASAGRAQPALVPLDVGSVVDSVRELMRASVSERCALEICCDAPGASVAGDASQIRQVLLNLVLNASDALPDGAGRVAVRVVTEDLGPEDLAAVLGSEDLRPGPFVVLEVRDDGCGMDAATTARVFDPFFTTRFSGRGLGMAAVLGIVRAHGGAIAIESEPGKGTRVRVLLPATRRCDTPGSAAAGETLADSRDPAPVDTLRCRVLLADDDSAVLELGREILLRAGFEVLTACGGHAALAVAAADQDLALAVVDLAMPDLGGAETRLRLREARPALPVILVSGYDASRASASDFDPDLDAFLPKPFEPDELIAAVRAALDRAAR